MSIFDSKMHYDNCLIFIDREWSTSEVSGVRARFADGLFELDYYGTDVEFTKHFKERFKSFYEKVLRDYDEALGYDKPTYEDCFDAMVADMTLIGYKPERTIDIDFKIPKPGQLCYDHIGGRYFYSQAETTKKVNEALNRLLKETHEATLSSANAFQNAIVTLDDMFNELYKEDK